MVMLLSPDRCARRGTERKLVSVRLRHRRTRPETTFAREAGLDGSRIRTGSRTCRKPHSHGKPKSGSRDLRLCMKSREAPRLRLCIKNPGSTRPAALHKKPGSTRSAALHEKSGNHTYCSFAQETAGAYSGQDPHASGSTGTPVS